MAFFKSVGLPLSGAVLSSLACAHAVSTLWTDATPSIVIGCEPDYIEGTLINGTRLVSASRKGAGTEELCKSVVEQLLSVGRLESPDKARLIMHGAVDVAGYPSAVKIPLENARPESRVSFGAISVAMTALKRSAFGANVIPPELRFRRSRLQLIPTYVLIVLISLLGITLLMREPYQYTMHAALIEQEINRVAPDARQASTDQAELNRLSEKYRALSGHFQSRDLNLESLRELSRILPPAAWLTSYTYQDSGLAISGQAESASEIQRVLEDSTLFKDVQFTSSVTRDANGKDKFSLKASIEGSK